MNDNRTIVNGWQAFCTGILSDVVDKSSIPPPEIDDPATFIHYLKSNGITCLLLDTLEGHDLVGLLPQDIVTRLQSFRRTSSVTELYNRQNILKTLGLLNDHNIDCLVLKGSALAYSQYEQPYFRVRGDTDILIRPGDKEVVDTLLIDNGYQKSNTVSGTLISHQNTYSITDNGIGHNYDIHWKLSNRNAFALRFDFDELYGRREPVTGLAGNIYRLSNTDALLHSIIHYYGHFPHDRERLIWIYDMHLLCSKIKPTEWAGLIELSADKQLDPLVAGALSISQTSFHTQLPGDVLATLEQSPVMLSKIEQQRLTASNWSRIEQFKSDWAVLSLAQRCRLIREYLLPPSEFILRQNDSNNRLLLPYFYLKRLVYGGLRVIRNPRKH